MYSDLKRKRPKSEDLGLRSNHFFISKKEFVFQLGPFEILQPFD